MSLKILLITDEFKAAEKIPKILTADGFDFKVTGSGSLGLRELLNRDIHLMLLDLGTADVLRSDWLAVMRQMESGKEIPVIVLSRKYDEDDVANAFRWGADDCILYPCPPEELSVRIRTVLRRRFDREQQLGQAISAGPIELDLMQHRCFVRGKFCDLRPREFELLEILMRTARSRDTSCATRAAGDPLARAPVRDRLGARGERLHRRPSAEGARI
jgi:DNA-binding response OmpR family regulator